jgi:signal peptide peptidase SppA
MSDDAMKEEYPDTDQRYAICQRQWDDKDKESSAVSLMPQVFGRVWAIVPNAMREILAGPAQQITSADMLAYRRKESSRFSNISGQVHILPLQGVITPRSSILSMLFGGTPLDYFGVAFDSAVENEKVGAIVIDIDSPGGSVYGVREMAEKIRSARGKKPVIASINGLGASAAYWLASAADEIVITPSGEVGSVGVIAVHEDISGLDAKYGLKYTFVTAGKYKAEGNEHEPLTDEAATALQGRVDDYYEMMVADIALGRGVSAEDVKSGFGEGRVVGPKQAKKAKMIDKIGSLEQVMRRLHPKTRQARAEMREKVNKIKAEINGENAEIEPVANASPDNAAEDLGEPKG